MWLVIWDGEQQIQQKKNDQGKVLPIDVDLMEKPNIYLPFLSRLLAFEAIFSTVRVEKERKRNKKRK